MVTYETPQALRRALENRLLTQSSETGMSLDRLRRRVLFERVVARLQAAEPGSWVLKGGMALEVRLRDEARLTKDIDLGLRGDGKHKLERLQVPTPSIGEQSALLEAGTRLSARVAELGTILRTRNYRLAAMLPAALNEAFADLS